MGQATATAEFLAKLRARLPALDTTPRLSVAFSGGLDSSVLLHGLAKLELPVELRALHVNHGLHADADAWEAHCRACAADLGIAYESRRVSVDRIDRGVEAAARQARYAAIADLLAEGEIVATAHHADDQLETVLLRMLRGSGVAGLKAIAELAELGAGILIRPLLDFSRAELEAQAVRWRLDWREDPTNRALEFDRNYLRAEVLPSLRERWPRASKAAVRLARHMRDADEILAAMAAADGSGLSDPVPRASLRALGPARQRNLLRALVAARDLPMPSSDQLEELRLSLAVTRPDAQVCVRWPGVEVRTYRDALYFLAPLPAVGPGPDSRLSAQCPWVSAQAGRLSLEPTERAGLPEAWVRAGLEVRFRHGGESFRPFDRAHTRPLKRWLSEAHILPWMRDRIPLLFHEERLVAVGDLWVADEARHQDAPYWAVRWAEHPPVR